MKAKIVNSFFPNAPFLKHLKKQKTIGFLMFSGGKKKETFRENGLNMRKLIFFVV